MIHAFFYMYLKEILYWSHNTVISYLTLVVLSVISSICIEIIKKCMHYNEAIAKLTAYILNISLFKCDKRIGIGIGR